MQFKLIARESDSNLVSGEDILAVVFSNGFLLGAINTKKRNGIIKVWSKDLEIIGETFAHEYPMYDMAAGGGTQFYTSCSDCVIHQWDINQGGAIELIDMLRGHTEPPSRLRYFDGRLYSGDSTGQVYMWENGECVGCLGTVEEIWDLLVEDGLLFTCRHLDVYMTSIRSHGRRDDDKITWSIKNAIPGRGPLYIMDNKLCFNTRATSEILVHDWKAPGTPILGKLSGHEAFVSSIVGDPDLDLIFSGGYDKQVFAWDLKSMKAIASLKLEEGCINAMAYDRKCKVLYLGGENRFVCAIKLV